MPVVMIEWHVEKLIAESAAWQKARGSACPPHAQAGFDARACAVRACRAVARTLRGARKVRVARRITAGRARTRSAYVEWRGSQARTR